MSTELEGRALDLAVAKLLGWNLPEAAEHLESSRWDYSTNPVHIPEMIDWLSERRHFDLRFRYQIRKHQIIHLAWWPDDAEIEEVIDGATIQQALARLVVRVAEVRKEKP